MDSEFEVRNAGFVGNQKPKFRNFYPQQFENYYFFLYFAFFLCFFVDVLYGFVVGDVVVCSVL